MNRVAFALPVLLAGTFASAAEAQLANSEERSDSPFSVGVSAGVEYDSNVSVNELDSNTGADDFKAVIDADFEFENKLGEKTELQLGYSFSQSIHDQFSNFDLQSHFASADLSHSFEAVDVGAAYRAIYTRLGGDGFMWMQQFSPYFSKFIGKKLFVRADYTYTDKDFESRTDRDATAHAGGADLYFFLNGVKTYFIAGYRYEDEDASDDQFDFQAHNLKARISQRVSLGSLDAKMKLGYRYEDRNYSSVTPSIGAVRDDTRHRFEAELEIPITERIYSLLEYEHGNFSSNLPSADYNQDVASARLGVRF